MDAGLVELCGGADDVVRPALVGAGGVLVLGLLAPGLVEEEALPVDVEDVEGVGELSEALGGNVLLEEFEDVFR